MSSVDIGVIAAAIGVIALLGWYFFGPRKAGAAQFGGGVQRVEVTVRGGYSPDVIRVRQGVPLELVFNRQESGDCTSRVVFADFGISAALPAYARTTVRLTPTRTGEFGFACGMNMIHGRLRVEPDGHGESAASGPPPDDVAAVPSADQVAAGQAEDGEARERRAEIADLAGAENRVRAVQAACSYSWRTPPRRSRRRM
jgi:Cu+-exporting ATPase